MVDSEKRRYPRVVLSIDDGYFGNFILPDNKSLMASIVNLSAGGVNFSILPSNQDRIKEGDILLLKNIAGAARLAFLEDIKTEIRWIKRLGDAKEVSVGCQFLDLSGPVLNQMIRFVDAERMVRGQYS